MTGDYCRPMTLLASTCADMPGMAGCRSQKGLCKNGTVVRQCQDFPAIPGWVCGGPAAVGRRLWVARVRRGVGYDTSAPRSTARREFEGSRGGGGVGRNKARVNERVCYHAEPRRRLDQVCYHAPRAGVLPRTAGVCVIVTYLTGPLFGRGRYPPHG